MADRIVHITCKFEGGILVDEDGRQLHEPAVPDVEGAVVFLHWEADPLSEDMRKAAEAVEQIVSWLINERGAWSVDYPSTAAYLWA